MLKKIKFYYDGGEKIYIEDEKIYWDTIRNQFRHKFNCCECGKPLDCMCYNTLFSARVGVEEGFICVECGEKWVLSEISIDDLLCNFDYGRKNKVNNFIDSLITEKEIKEFRKETKYNNLDMMDKLDIIRGEDKENILRGFVIGLLTKEERWDMLVDAWDEYPEGESCDI